MMLRRFISQFAVDEYGGPLVEAAVMIPILFVFLLGSVDFVNAFRQWNATTKAVEVGARLAAVSDPVASGLNSLPTNAVNPPTVNPGDPMPLFDVTCDGATSSCSCSGFCTGVGTFNSTAMNDIVFGRGKSACGASTSYYFTGMCNMLGSIQPANVKIRYTQTGLGFAGRSAGPVPTITVSVQNITFQYFFLKDLLGFLNRAIPGQSTTITGEGLSSS
jgi:TadE-like protein